MYSDTFIFYNLKFFLDLRQKFWLHQHSTNAKLKLYFRQLIPILYYFNLLCSVQNIQLIFCNFL